MPNGVEKNITQHIKEYKSPIRWALFALFVSIGLFLLEVALSFYQIYLSLLEGVVVVTILTEIVAFVLFALFGVVGLVILGVCGYFGLYWLRHPHTTDDMTEILNAISIIEKNVKTVKRDLAKIKTKVSKSD